MPETRTRSHRLVPMPGPGWTRVVVSGVVVVVAGMVLAVSIMVSNGKGDEAGPATEPKADNQSSSATMRPDGEGGVDDSDKKSKKPSKDKDKNDDEGDDKDDDSGGGDSGGDSGGSTSYPGGGSYDITTSGYCVGVGREGGDGKDVFILDSCGSASPQTKLDKVGSRSYHVTVYHPSNGTGCMAIDAGGGPQQLATPRSCDGSASQTFTLKKVSGGYQMATGGYCLGPLSGSASSGMELGTVSCGSTAFKFT